VINLQTEEQNEEILKRMPKTYKIFRDIWLNKKGSSPSAQSKVDNYGSGQKQ